MKTLIVEDHALFRDLLVRVSRLFAKEEDVVGVASAAAAEEAMTQQSFELVILDIELPDKDGIEFAEWTAQRPGSPRILGLSGYLDEYMVHRVMQAPFDGFVDKATANADVLNLAVKELMEGRCYFTDQVRAIQLALRRDPRAFPKLLSEHECTILRLIGWAASNEMIAKQTNISLSTVLWHRKQIMRKLGIHSAPELMLYAAQKGFARVAAARPPAAKAS
jgi:DNA-binding NarL/FixJ family response regulator